MGFFDKPKVNVEESPYDAYLYNLFTQLQRSGKGYSQALRPFLLELQGRPDRTYLDSYRGEFAPYRQKYLDIAANPIDDDLTKDVQSRFERSLGNSAAARGMIGQGGGADMTSNGMRDFFLDLRKQADARRAAALSSAEGIEGNIRELDLGGRERTMGDINKIGQWDLGFQGAGGNFLNELGARDLQRRMYGEALTQAGKSQMEQVNDQINATLSIAGSAMGLGKGVGGQGGGGGAQTQQEQVPATPMVGTQTSPGPWGSPGGGGAEYSLYGPGGGGYGYSAPGGGGMTPWGTPYSTGTYNLGASGYGDYGPYGGAYSRQTPQIYG